MGEAHTASPAVLTICARVTPCLAHRLRIDDHLELSITLAPDRDVGDAGHPQQPRHDRPAGQHRQTRSATRSWSSARYSLAGRSTRSAAAASAGGTRSAERAPVSAAPAPSAGRACSRCPARRSSRWTTGRSSISRLDRLQPRHAVQQIGLDRHRDQRLDFGTRQAERLGLDDQLDRREFRNDVQGHARAYARHRRRPGRRQPPPPSFADAD